MIRAERLPETALPLIVEDPQIVAGYLEDASGAPAGQAAGLARVSHEREAAALVRASRERGLALLPQAARSSLTGGAIPRGELIISVERMREIGRIERHTGGARSRVEPGVRLDELQHALDGHGLYYPPVPTHRQAMLGGAVATNAGGPATFKYGVTRQWVSGLRVLLFNGDLLALERGQAVASGGDSFHIQLSDGRELAVPTPDHRLPELKKISAGYFAADPLDLVDLFVGSEGTLGLITEITVELVPLPAALLTGVVFLPDRPSALRLADDLRGAALHARDTHDERGPDVRAIEYLDGSCLEILRRHGDAARLRVGLPRDARAALLFEMELDRPTKDAEVLELLERLLAGAAGIPEGPCVRLFRILAAHGAVERLELALPEDPGRRRTLGELREAVPQRVNELCARRRQTEPGLQKVGGDLIVPVERLSDMIDFYERGFAGRGLDHAIWGHLSDGNLHPNALARNTSEMHLGFEALLEFAAEAGRLGGCPLSEHGVGRNPIKQEMLRRFLGSRAIERMQQIKRALDPEGRFAPGVLFPA